MGLFDKAIKYAAGAAGAGKEGIRVLEETLAALSRRGLTDEAKRGASLALKEALGALKNRDLATPEVEETAMRLISLFAPPSDGGR